MNDSIRLTDTQTNVLTQAAYRPDGYIEPLPATLKGGAKTKVIEGLASRGLIVEHDGRQVLTDAGYAAVGRTRPAPEPETEAETPAVASEPQRRTRDNSKQAQVVVMLNRPEGATIAQICAATGWQQHTVRGTFAGAFKKKLGLVLTSEKPEGGERVYRIV